MNSIRTSRRVALVVRAVIAATLIVGGLSVENAFAQNNGSFSGSVQDAKKSQVPDAKVTATRTETGQSQSKRTDNSGFYSFPVLLPGHYNITVEKAGVQPQNKEGVEIFTGQASVLNFNLDVGQVVEEIQVSSDVAQQQTTTSAVADEIENKTITNYPLLDRRATQLQRLSGLNGSTPARLCRTRSTRSATHPGPLVAAQPWPIRTSVC